MVEKGVIKVLLVAHEFSPILGSECREGWLVARSLANKCSLTVICASGSQLKWDNYKTDVEVFFKNNGLANLNFNIVFHDQPAFVKLLSKINYYLFSGAIGSPVLYFVCYRIWQYSLFLKLKKDDYYKNFDIIHLLTSISFREPGFFHKLSTPFVWGPTGGLAKVPFTYLRSLSFYVIVKELIHRYLSLLTFYFSRRISRTIRKAKKVFVFSEVDRLYFEQKANHQIYLLSDSLCEITSDEKGENKLGDKLELIWVGQLIHRKQIELLLIALHRLPEKLKARISLVVLGDGPELEKVSRLCVELGLSKLVIWKGKVGREVVRKEMINSNLLIHTSYREAGSNVIGEALSVGLPVVCHNVSGMSIMINDNCGIKIPLISQEYSIEYLKNIFVDIFNNDSKLQFLHQGALARRFELSVESMTNNFMNEYKTILNK